MYRHRAFLIADVFKSLNASAIKKPVMIDVSKGLLDHTMKYINNDTNVVVCVCGGGG